MLVAAVALYLCQLESSVYAEQSWLQFVVALGIASVLAQTMVSYVLAVEYGSGWPPLG